MASAEQATASRRRATGAVLAVLVALVGLWLTDEGAVERGVLRSAVARDLERVAELAGLDAAPVDPRTTLPVMVVQEGGPTWITAEAEAAVDADPVFTRGEPHLLRVEVIEHAGTFGVRSQLWRQGWSLRAPEPLWIQPAPWIVLASLLAGAAWAWRRRSVLGGLVLAGLVAQLLLLVRPWPPELVRPSLLATWREGPLGHGVVALARALPDSSVALGAGVVTLCAVLMIFDHRRSSERGGGLVARGMLGVVGLLALVEASLRAGLVPWAGQPGGMLALGGAAALWWWAWRAPQPGPEPEPELQPQETGS
jgi:hypothetical protein